MLLSLYIKNLYLIDDLKIEFGDGLNILSGETGAGKSIILGAIGLIIGNKADTSSVRSGFNKGYVKAVFDISSIPELMTLIELKEIPRKDNFLVIEREINIEGKSKALVNMTNVHLSTLKEFGEYLLDISGQHQHHSLLRISNHIKLLDSFSKLDNIKSEFKQLWITYLDKKLRLKGLIEIEKEKDRKREFAEFSIKEIDEAELVEGENQNLEGELKLLMNHQKLANSTEISYNLLYEKSDAIIPSTEIVISELEKISSFDSNLNKILEEGREVLYKLESVKDYLRSFRDTLEYSPERIEEINERLDLINNLKKKYGDSITKILEHKEKCMQILEQIDKNEEDIQILKNELGKIEKIITERALNLSRMRMKYAKELENKVINELSYLGMNKAGFKVEFRYIEDTESFLKVKEKGVKIEDYGIDRIEFTISANIGEALKPLAKVASGGELSRIMLAIKTILIDADNISTVIFDEVDSGIGGETSNKVGKKIKEISKKVKIICITHSPQIAAKGNNNYLVEKSISNNRTVSKVIKLTENDKIKEIARMLSGENITNITLQHAKELILNKDN